MKLGITEQIQLLRSQLESTLEFPGVVAIASPRRGDGSTAISAGVAASLQAAGYRTLLLDAGNERTNDEHSGPLNLDQLVRTGPRNFALHSNIDGYDMISLRRSTLAESASVPLVRRAFEACKSSYDAVLVDTAALPASNLSLMAARAADVVLLTVRAGRRVGEADRQTVRMVEREELRLIGTVSVSDAFINRARETERSHAWSSHPQSSLGQVESPISLPQRVAG